MFSSMALSVKSCGAVLIQAANNVHFLSPACASSDSSPYIRSDFTQLPEQATPILKDRSYNGRSLSQESLLKMEDCLYQHR